MKTRPIGISVDSINKQKKFHDKNKFNFLLLSDPEKKIVKMFSGISILGRAHRKSFLIDPLGKLRKVYSIGDLSLKNAKSHAEKVIEDLSEFI